MPTISISVDSGKFMTKAVGIYEGSKFVIEPFPTRFYKFLRSESLDAYGSDNYTVEFEGTGYIIGSQGNNLSYDLSKSTDNHRIATYVAITQILKHFNVQKGAEVNLVIGCPPAVYRSINARKEARDYIVGNGKVDIMVDAIGYSFTINNCLVFPEAAGIVYLYPELFRGKRTCVIDIGGLNFNCILFDNLKPDPNVMFTTNLGSYSLETDIGLVLSSKYNTSLSPAEVHAAVMNNGIYFKGKIDPESTEIIKSICKEHINKIMGEVRKNINYETVELVFIGGSSVLLKDYILEALPYATVVENAQQANVEGFMKAMLSIKG